MSIQHDVQVLFHVGATGGLTDAELLQRFRESNGERAEKAFAVLMERHAGMVLRVCRSILRDENDAFDAVQATFLVLFRRADSLRFDGSAAPWLHGVALRTARCLRRSSAIRVKHETRWRFIGGLREDSGSETDDLAEIVHHEIARLPVPFREAVIVRDLEGLTQEQAAQRLGWPLGTLQSRLARGRERLRKQLRKRGLAPDRDVAGLAGFLATGSSIVPPQVLQAVTTGAASAAVFTLSQAMRRSLFMVNLRALIVVGVLTAGASAGITWAALRFEKAKPPEANAKDAAMKHVETVGQPQELQGPDNPAKDAAMKHVETVITKDQQAILDGPPPKAKRWSTTSSSSRSMSGGSFWSTSWKRFRVDGLKESGKFALMERFLLDFTVIFTSKV